VIAPPLDPKSRDEGKHSSNFTSGLCDCDTGHLNLQMLHATLVIFWSIATETGCLQGCDTDKGILMFC